jgi:hypothetical protein
MVKIIATHLRQSEKGNFVSLELQGDIELLQSQQTGRFYATARRCFISTTFDLATAKSFVGNSLPGSIARVACDPYAYKVPETGEEVTLSHTFSYIPSHQQAQEEQHRMSEELENLID